LPGRWINRLRTKKMFIHLMHQPATFLCILRIHFLLNFHYFLNEKRRW